MFNKLLTKLANVCGRLADKLEDEKPAPVKHTGKVNLPLRYEDRY